MIFANGQEASSCLPNCQNPVHLVKRLQPQVISLEFRQHVCSFSKLKLVAGNKLVFNKCYG